MFKSAVISILLFICCGKSAAQFRDYRFKSWDQQKGLPATSCLSIMQDNGGYIWLSTNNGVVRFTGIKFEELGRFREELYIEGEVRNTLQDKQGIYWIASYEKGLVSIDFSRPKEKQLTFYNAATLPGMDCPPYRSLKWILDDKDGNIWLGTESEGLYRFNKQLKSFNRIKFNNPYSQFSEFIRCIYQYNDHVIWVGIVNGIIYINTLTGEITYPQTRYSGVKYTAPPTVRNICSWNRDTFAVATDRGAFFYLSASREFVPVFPLEDSATYKSQEYHDVIKFSPGELWFATINRGIWFVNVRNKTSAYSYESNNGEENIGRHPVYFFYKDRKKNIWVCHSKGLSYLNTGKANFSNIPFQFYVSQPPSKDFITAANNELGMIRPDSLFTWTKKDKYPRPVPLSYKNENIGGVKLGYHKRLGYVLVNRKGIFSADTIKHKAVPVFLQRDLPNGLRNTPNISQILIDTVRNAEQWWFAVNESNLLYTYNWKSHTFGYYALYKDAGAKEINIWSYYSRMVKDAKGGLWIGTLNQGLFYMPDRSSGMFMHFTHEQPPGNQIPGNAITDLVLDKNNKLWATIRGVGLVNINLLKNKQLQYTVYGKDHGLNFLNVSQVKADKQDNLWLSSPNGLYRFDQEKKWFSYYGQSNGIRNPVLTLASAVDSSGNMYFTSTDYLLHFDPGKISRVQQESDLRLHAVIVNDKAIDIRGQRKLTLNPGENTLRFEFDLLDFDNPYGHYFYCKLSGYDKDWLLLQDVYRQSYHSLPGGKYVFHLKKVNTDGSHSKEITLAVTIADYFYNTAWFRILAFIATIVLIFVSVQFYVNSKLQKQRIILEQKRAIDLERMRISAELHDDVGGELSAISLLSELAQMNDEKVYSQQQLKKISTSSAGLVQRMNEIVWALNAKNDSLQNLLYYIHRFAAKYLDDVDIECRFEQPGMVPDYEMDGIVRRNIFLLVKEALNNVVKHSNATRVVIKIEIGQFLQIVIQDNGSGIKQESLTANSGNGLAIMQKRIRDLKGMHEISSNTGTIITFRIPL